MVHKVIVTGHEPFRGGALACLAHYIVSLHNCCSVNAGLLQGQHLNVSTKLLQSENFRSLQEEGGISWPEGLHYLYSKYDADIKKEDRSDCNFLGYNIANSRQKWKFELQNCFINKDCVQMLKAAENRGAFDSMKSMDLSNNHQLGNQGATLLGKL